MTDLPIIFSAVMIRALLAGQKVQTRRLAYTPINLNPKSARKALPKQAVTLRGREGAFLPSPWQKARPGDRCWVRENILQTLQAASDPSGEWHTYWTSERVEYLADEPPPVKRHLYPERRNSPFMQGRPSIHMPRWASRITLDLEAVRVEPLQAISRGDAMAEGCPFPNMAAGPDPRDWFRDLWNSLHEPIVAWSRNPEVVVLTYGVRVANIDTGARPKMAA